MKIFIRGGSLLCVILLLGCGGSNPNNDIYRDTNTLPSNSDNIPINTITNIDDTRKFKYSLSMGWEAQNFSLVNDTIESVTVYNRMSRGVIINSPVYKRTNSKNTSFIQVKNFSDNAYSSANSIYIRIISL